MTGQTKENTCFFTGHRTIANAKVNVVTLRTREEIYRRIDDGYRYFLCGGAVGFDTIAATQVLKVKAGGADIKLILALPCRDQTAFWKNTEMLRLYQRIKGAADEIIYVTDLFTEGCMKERNRYMAEASSACIAYYNGKRMGGTYQTVRMAEKNGVTIANVFETAEE